MSNITIYDNDLLVGTEWQGLLTYNSNETYPMILTVIKQNENKTYEGIIDWPSLKSTTKWLGTIKKDAFKFIEYEAIKGEENIELPNNYKSIIIGNLINGQIYRNNGNDNDNDTNQQKGEEKPTFCLKFNGINSKNEGFLELQSNQNKNNKKRRYNLVNNNSLDGPTIEDRHLAFLKLVSGADYWYKKSTKIFEGSKNREKEEPVGKSCRNCGQPIIERVDLNGNKIMDCPDYPDCVAPSEMWYYGF